MNREKIKMKCLELAYSANPLSPDAAMLQAQMLFDWITTMGATLGPKTANKKYQ